MCAGLKACAGDVEALGEALELPPLSLMQSFNEVEVRRGGGSHSHTRRPSAGCVCWGVQGRLTTARKALNYGKLDIDRYEEVTDALRDVNHFITTMGKVDAAVTHTHAHTHAQSPHVRGCVCVCVCVCVRASMTA